MKKTSNRLNEAPPPDFSPGSFSEDTARKFFELNSGPTVDRNRQFLINIIQAATICGLVWTVKTLIPLHTVETFQVNKYESGRLQSEAEPVGHWEPDKDSIAYFLNQWGEKVFGILPATIRTTTEESSQMVIGTAGDQLRSLRMKDNPFALLKDAPDLVRTYHYKSINFLKDDVALLRFRTTTRRAPGAEPKEEAFALTITFVRIKPTTREQVMRNPAGLYVSNFNLSEESVSK